MFISMDLCKDVDKLWKLFSDISETKAFSCQHRWEVNQNTGRKIRVVDSFDLKEYHSFDDWLIYYFESSIMDLYEEIRKKPLI